MMPSSKSPDRRAGVDGRTPPFPLRGRAIGELAVAYAVLVSIGVVLGLVITGPLADTALGRLDSDLARWMAGQRTLDLNDATHAGSDLASTVNVVIGLIVLVGVMTWWFKRWKESLTLAVALALESLVFVTVSTIVGRERPPVEQLDVSPPTASFPSGHVGAAFALYLGLVLIVWWRSESVWLRMLSLVLGIAAAVAVAVSRMYRGMHFLTDVVVGALLGLACLAIAAVVIQRAIDRRHEGEVERPPGGRHRRDMKVTVLYNPVGDAEATESVRAALDERGITATFVETEESDAGRSQAEQAAAAGCDLVIVVGGDGTVRACADGLAGTGAALGIVPAGTGNLLARNLDVPLRHEEALAVAIDGRRTQIDVGSVNGEIFAVIAGAGIDAAIMDQTDREAKERLGVLAYVVEGAKHVFDDPFSASISLDGDPGIDGEWATVMVANLGRLQGGVDLFPDSEAADGLIDVLAVNASSPGEIVAAALDAVGSGDGDHVIRRQVRTFQVAFEHPTPYQLDGEARPATQRLDFSARPGALIVMTPRRDT